MTPRHVIRYRAHVIQRRTLCPHISSTHITSRDDDVLRQYESQVGAVLKQFSGTLLARAGDVPALGGDPAVALEGNLSDTQRHVLVSFPDLATAQRFYDSDAYGPLRKLREANSSALTVILAGVS